GHEEVSCCGVIYRTKHRKRDTPLTDDSSATLIWSRVDREASGKLSDTWDGNYSKAQFKAHKETGG
ncbi:Secretagogin, partial [Dissostichus eleginoides]